jgi:hypothetical protein
MRFGERDCTMKSIFEEPEDTTVFDLTYGAFLIHCGLTAMGNPSGEDDHPMHGELPNGKYREAFLETGEDEAGRWLKVSGVYQYRNGLEFNYTFSPSLRLEENSMLLKMEAGIENLRENPLAFMYMAHINWLPVDGSHLVYSAKKDAAHIEVFCGDFDLPEEQARRLDDFTGKLIADPAIGDVVDSATQTYYPELCSCITYQSDENGMAHAIKVLPEGAAYYVGFETGYLPNGLRWVARTGDEDAFGFALPTTGNHLGLAYAKRHGLQKLIAPHSKITLRYDFGMLDSEEASKMEMHINSVLSD